MAMTQNLSVHRHWEDWCSMGIGAVILLSPIIGQTVEFPYVTLNAVMVGVVVMLLAWLELILLETWEEYLEFAAGLWLAASPWVFGYSDLGLPTVMHVALGGAVAALAVVEFWQDQRAGRHAA
jgi:ABC-type branched-subunit amino acid transport system permease subunit